MMGETVTIPRWELDDLLGCEDVVFQQTLGIGGRLAAESKKNYGQPAQTTPFGFSLKHATDQSLARWARLCVSGDTRSERLCVSGDARSERFNSVPFLSELHLSGMVMLELARRIAAYGNEEMVEKINDNLRTPHEEG